MENDVFEQYMKNFNTTLELLTKALIAKSEQLPAAPAPPPAAPATNGNPASSLVFKVVAGLSIAGIIGVVGLFADMQTVKGRFSDWCALTQEIKLEVAALKLKFGTHEAVDNEREKNYIKKK